MAVKFGQVIRKKRTSLAETFERVIDTVMQSFRIQLSSDAQTQRAAAKKAPLHEKLVDHMPPYDFEEFDILNELDLAREVSAANNYDVSMPRNEFNRQMEEAECLQKQKTREIRQRTLASHMRFEMLEDQRCSLEG